MNISKVQSTIATKFFTKGKKAAPLKNSKALAREKAKIVDSEIEKQRVMADKELKILPEYNFFGLPRYM